MSGPEISNITPSEFRKIVEEVQGVDIGFISETLGEDTILEAALESCEDEHELIVRLR